MGLILLEALLALALLAGIVWWTMFSGRPRGEPPAPDAPDPAPAPPPPLPPAPPPTRGRPAADPIQPETDRSRRRE